MRLGRLPVVALVTGALLTGCCPCEEDAVEKVSVSPEVQARLDFYAVNPDWAVIEGRESEPYSPMFEQLHNGVEPTQLGSVSGGLLVCKLTVASGKNWDAFGGDPDPACGLRVPTRTFERFAASGRDSHRVHLGWFDVSLKKGDEITLDATDMDVARHDYMGERKLVWDGGSHVLFQHKNFEGDCRFVPSADVAEAAAAELAGADIDLEQLEAGLEPNPDDALWGYPSKDAKAARKAIMSAAALSGWRAPRVEELRARYDTAEARWQKLVTASINAEAAKAPVPGTFVELQPALQIKVVEAVCDQALANKLATAEVGERPCFVRLHLRNTGSEPASWPMGRVKALDDVTLIKPNGHRESVGEFYAVLPDKRRITVYLESHDEEPATLTIAPGATVEIGVHNGVRGAPLTDCKLLRAGPHLLRLR